MRPVSRQSKCAVRRAWFRASATVAALCALAFAPTSSRAEEAVAPPSPVVSTAPALLDVSVVDAATGDPVPYANLVLLDSRRGFLGSPAGAFHLELAAGVHRVRVMHVSYEASPPLELTLAPGEHRAERIALTPHEHVLPTLEVTSEAKPSPRVAASGVRSLEPDELSSLPNLRDDPFQMLRILPGVAADDVGSEFHMRGGGIHETLVRIDGMEVRQLFHGRDFGGITGIIPFGVVDQVDVYLGGFPAEYGGRLSGVVDLDLKGTAREGFHMKSGVDAVSARVLAEATGKKSTTFFSVREGYLDRVLDLVQDEAVIQPAYRDLLLRTVRRPSSSQSISFNYLRSEDHLYFEDGTERHFVNADYIDNYAWSTWKGTLGTRVAPSATVYGALSRQLRSVGFDGRDDHRLSRAGSRLDLALSASEAHLVKVGGQIERETGTTSVRSEEVVSIAADGSVQTLSGYEGEDEVNRVAASLYAQDEWRPASSLAFGLGFRASTDSDTDELRWNPRASTSWQMGRGWTLSGAWGRYDQAPNAHISEEPDLRLTSDRASWAEHVVAGISKKIGSSTFGVEAYEKDFHRLDGLVERTRAGAVQREVVTRGGSNGLEVYGQRTSPGANWWATYTLAKSQWGNEGRTFLRDFDQRHSFSLANTFQVARNWDIGTTYSFHSGHPYTVQSWKWVADAGAWSLTEGPPNGSRLPAYHRVDLRLRRNFRFDGWKMSVYAEGLNLTNHDNVLWYSWGFERDEAGVRPVRSERNGMPALPTLGIEVEF